MQNTTARQEPLEILAHRHHLWAYSLLLLILSGGDFFYGETQ
jgi:hypothetical protein